MGIHIPAPDEIRVIIANLEARFRPLLLTAIFTGLRISELRGLRWEDIDLKRAELHVHQRADRYNVIGRTKTAAGERTVPLPPIVVSVLREHKAACAHSAHGSLGLAFPNSKGKIDHRNSIITRGLHPAQIAAGIIGPKLGKDGMPKLDKSGQPIMGAKYRGMHALRHFYASWCINRRVDGGLELPLKMVQVRLGHATIQETADTYGHLFPRGDDGAELRQRSRRSSDKEKPRRSGAGAS